MRHPSQAESSVARAAHALVSRQEGGVWPADCSGPLFLLPGFVFAYRLTNQPLPPALREGFVRYLHSTQRPDGGWGLHTEGPSTVLGTSLSYVALRLLGEEASAAELLRARLRLRALGGAEEVPSWGKFWLALLGIYDWSGVAPVPPELWLLPRWAPIHPGRMWCHTRGVLLPMSHLWGRRPAPLEAALTAALRREIFAGAAESAESAESIDWPALRDRVAATDRWRPPSFFARAMRSLLSAYERRPLLGLRTRALAETRERLQQEDEASSFLTIGPVSKALHMVAAYVEGGDSPAFRRHLERMNDYLFHGAEGIKVRGYHGTELWDCAFAAQALITVRTLPGVDSVAVDAALERAHAVIDTEQVRCELPDGARFDRGATRGGWPFSTAQQGWIVSDCTAEALKVALALEPHVPAPIPARRLEEAVGLILGAQNRDGGWSEYEPTRGGWLLQELDAAEMFDEVMVARSYTECTGACLEALAAFSRRYPAHRALAIARALRRGERFLRQEQRPDGSFYGAWGVCFTYGTWFGVRGLRAVGATERDPALGRARRFLIDHQSADGGWGEALATCLEDRWVPAAQSQVVQTAWAILALLLAGGLDEPASRGAIERGVALLAARQLPEGGWAKGTPAGVFNRTCAIDYDNYRYVMPLWALGEYGLAAARRAEGHEPGALCLSIRTEVLLPTSPTRGEGPDAAAQGCLRQSQPGEREAP